MAVWLIRVKEVPDAQPNADGEWTEHRVSDYDMARVSPMLESMDQWYEWVQKNMCRPGNHPVQVERRECHD